MFIPFFIAINFLLAFVKCPSVNLKFVSISLKDVSSRSDQVNLIYSSNNQTKVRCFRKCNQMPLCLIVKYLSDSRMCKLYNELAFMDLIDSSSSRLLKILDRSTILPIYAGIGYDLIKGNPKTNVTDPGFRLALFAASYEMSQTTLDGSYYIPDYVNNRNNVTCSYASSVTTNTGMTGYQNDLSLLASTNGTYGLNGSFVGFTASAAYKSRQSAGQNNTKIFTDAWAACQIYSFEIQDNNTNLSISYNFNQSINQALAGAISWQNVIASFGTHYVIGVTLGGRTHLQHKLNRTSYQKMSSMGLDVKKLAQIKFANWSGDTSVNYSSYASQLSFFESMIDDSNVVYVGGKPPSSGVSTDWRNLVQSQFSPVMYMIRPITKLFNSIYFPWLTSDQLTNLTNKYTAAVTQYCVSLNCSGPSADPALPSNVTYSLVYTTSYGYTSGTVFNEPVPSNPLMTVRRVLIRSSDGVNNMQFLLSDGVRSYYTGAYGSLLGTAYQWDVPSGETITNIDLRMGGSMDAITFITNKGNRSPTYGNPLGGTLYNINLGGNLVSFNGQYGNYLCRIQFTAYNVVY